MLLSFKCFNNSQQLVIIGLTLYFSKNYFLKKQGYQMPLAQIIQNQLINDFTNTMVKYIRFNLDMIF